MCEERYLVKMAQVASVKGYTINVLLDLGNCFRINSDTNKISKKNIQLFLDNAFANVKYFSNTSQDRYKQDLDALNRLVSSLLEDTVTFWGII